MYLFGGSNLESENHKFFALDLNQFIWNIVNPTVSIHISIIIQGVKPVTRDEHTANLWDTKMVVFGGFVLG
jgi:hypothetical protein